MPTPRIAELLTSPWALMPEKLAELQAVYARHLRGESADLAAIEAKLGRPLASEQQTYAVNTDGVATLEVSGVMAPKANLLMQISGGVSTQMLTAQLESMAADARVRAVAVVWDSPGGNVQGVPAAAGALAKLAAAKPTVSLARGAMASAAYWVGSAANVVLLEGATDVVGSLGVYQRLAWSDPQPNTLDIVRGKYKRLSLNGQPPSAEVLAEAEAQVDYLYTVLVDAVAQHRGVPSADVLQHMADGRVFTGQMAIDAGLADGMSTLPDLIEALATEPRRFASRRKARIGASSALPPTGAVMDPDQAAAAAAPPAMTRETLELDQPALVAALRTEFSAAGAQAERDRIAAVRAQALPGHESLIEQLAMDGRTTGPEAAAAVVKAEQDLAATRARDLRDDKPAPLPAAASATAEGDADPGAGQSQPTPMANARELAAAIAKKQAEARAAGREIGAVEALALVKKEQAHG